MRKITTYLLRTETRPKPVEKKEYFLAAGKRAAILLQIACFQKSVSLLRLRDEAVRKTLVIQ
jgi:hypothetical protein